MNGQADAELTIERSRAVLPVRSVERAVALLRAFSPDRPWLGLADLSRAASLDKATARRLLLTLADGGLVVQHPERREWALGLAVLELSAAVPESRTLREASLPILAALAGSTRMTAFLSVVRSDAALCIERVNGLPEFEINWWRVGERIALNCGSGPRVLLAFLAEDAFERVAASRAEQRTRKSETAAEALRVARERIRARGWELAVDDFVDGLSGVGVPVIGADDAVVAALSVSGLTPTVIAGGGAPGCLPALQDAAARLGAILRTRGAEHWRRADEPAECGIG